MRLNASVLAGIDYSDLPESLRPGMRAYMEHGIRPGAFLLACLKNDLSGACAHADNENRQRIFDIALWLYNEAPTMTYGSPEKVNDHMTNQRGR